MALRPIDFGLQEIQPFNAVLSALQAGQARGNLSLQQLQNQRAQEARNEAKFRNAYEMGTQIYDRVKAEQRTKQAQEDAQALLNAETVNPEDYASFAFKYPELAKPAQQAFNSLTEEQRKVKITKALQLYNALNSGKQDIAISMLEESAQAAENSGNPQQAQIDRAEIEKIRQNPELAKRGVAGRAALALGPDQFIENFGGLMEIEKEQRLAEQGIDPDRPFQKSRTILVDDPKQGLGFLTSIFEPTSGKMTASFTKIEGNLVSALGESREEQIKSRATEAREKSLASKFGTDKAARISEIVEKGIAAADSTAILRRSLELLDIVDTGGFNRALLSAKSFFGVEGADEAELSYNLGKNVLSQLKTTFGSAFTEGESNKLEALEASISRNPQANKRILKQALNLAERAARRALSVANQSKEDFQFEINEIKNALEFKLEPEKATQPPTTKQTSPSTSQSATAKENKFKQMFDQIKDPKEKTRILQSLTEKQIQKYGLERRQSRGRRTRTNQ